jgi:hypothetical protein
MHGAHDSSVGEEDMEQGDNDTQLRNQRMHQIPQETIINSQIEPPRIFLEQPTLRASSRINLSTFGDTKGKSRISIHGSYYQAPRPPPMSTREPLEMELKVGQSTFLLSEQSGVLKDQAILRASPKAAPIKVEDTKGRFGISTLGTCHSILRVP